MSRRVVITGLGPISGIGLGIDATWQSLLEGKSAVARISAFDPSGFPNRIAAEIKDLKISSFVPKSYRKNVKVMARDIEFAVAAADLAARDAKLTTKGTIGDPPPAGAALTYKPDRVGVHIGAGLIAAELNELTDALATSVDDEKNFDIHKWGKEGMGQLTPLWMLKYLPNMLSSHVTIIHDSQGPSNTITCDGASSDLSIGESLRVIQRGQADASFSGGTESKFNPMAFLRQIYRNMLVSGFDDAPTTAVQPFGASAQGTVLGEGGGMVILEALDTFTARKEKDSARAYAELVGFGASQSVFPDARNCQPEPSGRGLAVAIKAALRDAGITIDQVSVILPIGLGSPQWDASELASLKTVFGDKLASIPLIITKPAYGLAGAGAGSLDACVLAKAIFEQKLPPTPNFANALPGLAPARTTPTDAKLEYGITYNCSANGQNAAIVLKKI
jgi:3-oxoacyl-[acyl-carrier-protein] synthase II